MCINVKEGSLSPWDCPSYKLIQSLQGDLQRLKKRMLWKSDCM